MPLEPVIGQIMAFAGMTIPRGWTFCNGAIMSINQNQGLFSVIGTTYGGDGVRTFALPDLRGRAILGVSGATGPIPAGMVSGTETVKLTAAQIPAHNHLIKARKEADSSGARVITPGSRIFCKNTIPTDNPTKIFSTAGAGRGEKTLALDGNVARNTGDQPHNNMQPYLVVNYLIALQGIYPSRN